MKNNTMVSVFIGTIDKVGHHEEPACVVLNTGVADLFFDEKPFEIKVGDNKVKISTLDFMKAFKDMFDTGVFELDQIDSAVWNIEFELESVQQRVDYFEKRLEIF
jgi:hypothetical protein